MRDITKNEINLISGAECLMYPVINGQFHNPTNMEDYLEIKIENIAQCINICCYFHEPSKNITSRYYYTDEKHELIIPEIMKPGLILHNIIVECAEKTSYQP